MAYTPRTRRTFYVASNGNNNNDGLDPSRAWATVAKVNTAPLKAGDTVLFEGGKEFTGRLEPKSGAAGNPIVYGSYGMGKTIIVGDNTSGCFIGSQVANVVMLSMKFKGINQTLNLNDGIYIENGAVPNWIENILLYDLEVTEFGSNGLGTYFYSQTVGMRNIEVVKCQFYANRKNGVMTTPSYETATCPRINVMNFRHCRAFNNKGFTSLTTLHSGSGFILGGLLNSVIEYCEAYNNGGFNGWTSGGPGGIFTYECQNVTIQHCESHHNRGGTGTARVDGLGFDIDGGCTGCVVQFCYSHDNEGSGYSLYEYGATNSGFTNNTIRYNISVNDARAGTDSALSFWSLQAGFTNNRVHNNLFILDGKTVVAGTPSLIRFLAGSFGTLNIVNNIFVIDGPNVSMLSGTAQGTWSNNWYYARGGANLNYNTGGTVGDPYLLNTPDVAPTVGVYSTGTLEGYLEDFKLQAISPCINAGTGTIAGYTFPTRDFWGNVSPIGTINVGPHEIVP